MKEKRLNKSFVFLVAFFYAALVAGLFVLFLNVLAPEKDAPPNAAGAAGAAALPFPGKIFPEGNESWRGGEAAASKAAEAAPPRESGTDPRENPASAFKGAPRPPAAAEFSALSGMVEALSGGKAMLEDVFLTEEGPAGLVIRAYSRVWKGPVGRMVLAFYFPESGVLSLGPVLGPKGGVMQSKYFSKVAERALSGVSGVGDEAKKDFYVFIDPLCPESRGFLESPEFKRLTERGLKPFIVPVALLNGSLPYGESYLATGSLNPDPDVLTLRKLMYEWMGNEEDYLKDPVPDDPKKWLGPSRVMENTFRLRSLGVNGNPPASPSVAYRLDGEVRLVAGPPDEKELKLMETSLFSPLPQAGGIQKNRAGKHPKKDARVKAGEASKETEDGAPGKREKPVRKAEEDASESPFGPAPRP
ncbi:MAG: hypothetical protein LBR53_01490 [Deltaproteobacteria bacterium]|nr:hypothetical protein [Deltaproteobacteria bacterium]